MKEYSFVVNDFSPKESQSPDGVLLQMSLDKAESFVKSFSEQVAMAKRLHPEKMTTWTIGVALCGSLFLDSINGAEAPPA